MRSTRVVEIWKKKSKKFGNFGTKIERPRANEQYSVVSIKDSPGKGTTIIIYNIAPNQRNIQGSNHKEFLTEPGSIKLQEDNSDKELVRKSKGLKEKDLVKS